MRYFYILSILFCFLFVNTLTGQSITFSDSVFSAPDYKPDGLDPGIQNDLDAINNQGFSVDQQRRFRKHCSDDINFFKRIGGHGTTYFESEKAAYPHAMHSILFGLGKGLNEYVAPAKTMMQADAIYDLGSDLTEMVDLFPSFTLKGQIPKYFYFGKFLKVLDTAHLAKMRRGIYKWTHEGNTPRDPLLRPNPYFLGNTGCWDPRCRNSWVDTRNTDNLKAMRETSIYLFAEETENQTIKTLYFDRIRNHTGALFHVGYSEWDSETYVPHAMGPYYNLFAFTKSPAMKRIAKASLDWYFMAASFKYFNGMSTGPSKRSNGSANVRLGGAASDMPYLYFGEPEIPESEIFDRDRDSFIAFISGYRPPQALYQLASKNFRLPVEVTASKPPYGSFNATSAARPDANETTYFAKTYQMGSVLSANASNDTRPFKLGAVHPGRGVDVFYANTTDNDTLTHAKYQGDQIGQYENLLIFLRKGEGRKFFFQIPSDVPFDSSGGIWFFPYFKTWIAVRPLNIKPLSVSILNGIYANHKEILTSKGQGEYAGFALEVADDDEYPDYEAFKAAVISRQFDASHLQDSGMVRIEGKGGKFLKVRHNPINQRPFVYRNSEFETNYLETSEYNVYQSITPPTCTLNSLTYNGQNLELQAIAKDSLWGPVFQNWKKGVLKILTNDHYFEGKFDALTGNYTWKELVATNELRKGKIAKIELLANGVNMFSTGDSVLINAPELSFSIPFGQSGNFDFQLRVWDEEGNKATSNIINLNITSANFKIMENEFQIFPNPALEKISVLLPVEKGSLSIFQTDGRLIRNVECFQKETSISVAELAKGVYWLRWQSGNQSFVKSFVKK